MIYDIAELCGFCLSDGRWELRLVQIDDGVWIAANAFISPGVHLPEGVIVSAGSVVGKKAYKPYSVIAGNPARIIGFREGYAPIK